MRTRFLLLWAVALSVLATLLFAPGVSVVHASDSGVVISAAYGGGNNAGAAYTHDFIELFNGGASAVSLNGWSVQYAAASGDTWIITNLPNFTLLPGQYFLTQQSGGSGINPLPTPDATGSAAMALNGNFKIALMQTTTALNGTSNPIGNSDLVDFYGGGSASASEGANGPGGLTTAQGVRRLDAGCQDTDNNGADFEVYTVFPNARNSSSPLNVCITADPPANFVISAVYGGGGNSNSTPDWSHDYVELFNGGSTPVSIDGWSLQYGAADQSTWTNTTNLPDFTIQPGQYFLVQEVSEGNGGAALPTPDLISPVPHHLASVSHKVALFTTTTPFAGGADPTGSPDLVDFVGYGSSNAWEGTGPAPALSNGTQAVRTDDGCQDTDDNSADFIAENVFTPRNTSSPLNPCSWAVLEAEILASNDVVTAGDTVSYTVTVTNTGDADAINMTYTVTIGGSAYPGTVSNVAGANCILTPGNPTTFECTAASLTPSSDVSLSFDVTPTVEGTITVDVVATADAPAVEGDANETTTVSAPSQPGKVVISAVYGGGGNSGATYTHDYVELFNAGTTAVNMTEWSVQWTSASGTFPGNNGLVGISATLQPGQYYLVQMAAGSGGSQPLPTPDAIGSAGMGAGSGKVALASNADAITGIADPDVVDFVGYGAANESEGESDAPAPSAVNAVFRVDDGCQDTDDNGADFVASAAFPNARNTLSPFNPCFKAELSITLTDTPDPVEPNEVVNYNMGYGNGGNADAVSTVVLISLSGSAYPGTVTLTNPMCLFDDPSDIVTCSLGTLAPTSFGAAALFTITPTVEGTITVDAVIGADPPAVEGIDSEMTTVSFPSADVTVEILGQVDPVYSHQGATPYMFEVVNSGVENAVNTTLMVTLSGDAGPTFIETPAIGCTYPTSVTLECNFGTLTANGGSAPLFIFEVAFTGPGTIVVDATVSADEPEIGGNNTDQEITAVLEGCDQPSDFIGTFQENGALFNAAGGTSATIQGVVTGDFQAAQPDGLNPAGFYMQDTGDGIFLTSDGIFVQLPETTRNVAQGDLVRVIGTIASEAAGFNQTKIIPTTTLICGTATLPAANIVTMPFVTPGQNELEQFESMLVIVTAADEGPLTVTEAFQLHQFGQYEVSAGGRLMQPTNVVEPGVAANDMQDANNANRLFIDDGRDQTPPVCTVPNLECPTEGKVWRIGDTTDAVQGVLGFAFSRFRVHTTVDPVFTNTNVRPTSAPSVGGRLKVASFNVLNFFNGNGLGGGFPTSRGADSLAEYNRQLNKLVIALDALDADVIGLMEIENDEGENQAIEQLTAALNDYVETPGLYGYIDTGPVGGDEIRVAIIYRTTTVAPSGAYAVLDDVAPFNLNTRPPVVQTFSEVSTGAKFTVVVNHFKSKGSCPLAGDPNADQGDGQSCWNPTRILAANELLAWLATDPTGQGDPDVLIIGDLNSYAKEDPIDVFIGAGYTNLIETYGGANAYGYVFGAQSGYLDYALSNATLTGQITGTAEYHINADEPLGRDYNDDINDGTESTSEYHQPELYELNEFRTSDHDPVLIGITLTGADGAIESTPSVTAGDDVTVTVTDLDLTGTEITITVTSDEGESETLTLDETGTSGEYSGTFVVSNVEPTAGNDTLEATSGTLTFTYIDALDSGGAVDTPRTDTTTVEPPVEVGSDGTIESTPSITAGDDVTVTVTDLDLTGPTIDITVTSDEGESETLTLDETGTPGEYTGTFAVSNVEPTPDNDDLEATGGTLTFTYIDALDSGGAVDTPRTDTTTVEPPTEVGSDGTIESTPSITAGDDVTVTVTDLDLTGPTIDITVTSDEGESETLTLDETGTPGEYAGTFAVSNVAPTPDNDDLEATGGTLTFTYIDALDSGGAIDTPRTDTTTVEPVQVSTTELLVNGDFEEDTDDDKVPDDWTLKNGFKDKLKCNKPDKTVAYSGECAFKFKGGVGEKAKLQQVVDTSGVTLTGGDTLSLSAYFKGGNPAVKAKFILKVKYGTGDPVKENADVSPSEDYVLITVDTLTLDSADVSQIKVMVKHKSIAGKLWVDAASLILAPGEGVRGNVLPVPPAPDGFRGGN